MSIPKIASYTPPQANEFTNKVSWTFQPQQAALLIHDMQEYFVRFYGDNNPLIEQVISKIAQLRAELKAQGVKIIYTAQPEHQSLDERGLLNDMWGPGINKSPEQQAIVAALAPEEDDIILTKWRYSAFVRSELEDILKSQGIDQLAIVGIYANIGCMISANDAFMRDIKPFMLADCVADFNQQEHIKALEFVSGRCGFVCDSQSILNNATSDATDPLLTLAGLQQNIADMLEMPAEELPIDDNLLDYGLDSIQVMQLIEKWQALGVNLTFQQLGLNPTIQAWFALLNK